MLRWLRMLAVLACIAPASAQATSLLLIGDSITDGVIGNATTFDPFDGESFAERLAAVPGLDVVNAACVGSSVFEWSPFDSIAGRPCGLIDRTGLPILFEERVFPADVAVVMLGTNDALVWNEPAAIYRANLEALAIGLLNVGVGEVILMTPPPYVNAGADRAALLAAYENVVLNLCAERGFSCVDTYAIAADDPGRYFLGGKIHPDEAYHAAVANELLQIVPEPSTLTQLLTGLVGFLLVRRKMRA